MINLLNVLKRTAEQRIDFACEMVNSGENKGKDAMKELEEWRMEI